MRRKKSLRGNMARLFVFIMLLTVVFTSSYAEEKTISVMSAGLSWENQRSIADLFHEKYHDYKVCWVDDLDDESVKTRILLRDPGIDVMSISSMHGTLQELIEKDYYVDLAGAPIVRSNMDLLLDSFHALFFPSGDKNQIPAYPWNITFQPLAFWDSNVAKYMDINDENEVLTFDYIVSLMNQMESENDESVIITDGSENPLILPAFECCKMQSVSEKGTLQLYTPEFENVLQRLLKYNKSTTDYEGPANPLITICPADGEMLLTQGRKWKRLSLYEDKTVPLGCYFQSMIVNPYSEHIEEAVFLIDCIAQKQSETVKMALFDLGKEELPNPDYEKQISELQESIELYENQMDKHPEDSDYWEAVVKDTKEMMNLYSPYIISKESYSYYRSCVDENLYIFGNIPFEAANIDSYIYDQYLHLCREEVSPASFLQSMDRIIYMMAMENSGS